MNVYNNRFRQIGSSLLLAFLFFPRMNVMALMPMFLLNEKRKDGLAQKRIRLQKKRSEFLEAMRKYSNVAPE